jgi:hypothetical protein
MKPTPLLDFWHKPAKAGDPVALLATTFALEPAFFEKNCLARFLEVSSVDEETGSIEDIVATVELHDLLQKARVTVLADRSAPVQRSSLLWDLLSCHVDGGLLHAKVAVLLWDNATRVILGSPNLTAAGYRRQIELALAADLGPECLFPTDVLNAIANELDSYLMLVPGLDANTSAFKRAASTVALFRQRIVQQPTERTEVRVAFAPTNATARPLDQMGAVWSGPQALRATHLSPYWDSTDTAALAAARKLLTGRPASERLQSVAIVLSPRGQTSFSNLLAKAVDSVRQLKALDNEVRTLHAKCLLIESNDWVAALVGSSNHTKAGFGLNPRNHREMNVWIGASLESKEGQALLELVQLADAAPANAEEVEPQDEDESELPALPVCFGLCRLTRSSSEAPWELRLGIASSSDMPAYWEIRLAAGNRPILNRVQWEASHASGPSVVTLTSDSLPLYILVGWQGNEVPWAVIAENRHGLPPGPELSRLRAHHLLDALASGRSLAQALREEMERRATATSARLESILDPLKRLEIKDSLLRKGRAMAASLSAMQRRLERQVISVDTLHARLASPLGPVFVAVKVLDAFEAGEQSRAEAIFTIAEITLSVGRIDWPHVLAHIDRAEGLVLVNDVLEQLDGLRERLGDEPAALAAYAQRAIKKARECLIR